MLAERGLAASSQLGRRGPEAAEPDLSAIAQLDDAAELVRELARLIRSGDEADVETVAGILAMLREFKADAMAMGRAAGDAYNEVLDSTGDPGAAKLAGHEALERAHARIAIANQRKLAVLESRVRRAHGRRTSHGITASRSDRSRRESHTRRRSSDAQPAVNGSRGSPRLEPDEPERGPWYEEDPVLHRLHSYHGKRQWHGSHLWRIVDLAEADDDEDRIPSKGKPDEIAVARASRRERTHCCQCRRPFTDLGTGGKSPGRYHCRACEAKRKAAQRRKKKRELALLEERHTRGDG